MLLSIVIPVYNVEPYVQKCLESCIYQEVPKSDYEIIVVNDGTKDNSMSIVHKIAKEYENIRIESQENQGLSIARNNGLAYAKGDYVWFVDSDDWIEKGCLKRILPMLRNDVDLLQMQYRYVYDDVLKNRDILLSTFDGYKSGREVIRDGGLPAPAQFTIYRKHFLEENKLYFMPGIYHEDSEFKPRATYLANKIAIINLVCYNYYQRTTGSITSSFVEKNAVDLIKVMNSLYEFSRTFTKEDIIAFNNIISLNMNSLLLGYRNLSVSEKKRVKKLLCEKRNLFRCMMRSSKLKYKLEGICFCLSVNLGFLLHNSLR